LKALIIILSICISFQTFAQKVGIVLSGGGAMGFAHIGVLKALEEHQIPIDYITGASSGALVGAMYAAGYSPKDIEIYVKSERFNTIANGTIESHNRFLFFKEDDDANIISLGISLDSLNQRILPAKFKNSTYLDYQMLVYLGTVSEVVGGDFSKLLVPFQCVASDITTKKSILLKEGKLNEAVRASMTYPFFIQPIKIENRLLFDGGLYNNFPSDIMEQSFKPDFIIGSNVSSNATPPSETDIISQIINMTVTPTNFSIPQNKGIMISPKTGISTFSFNEIDKAIQSGYVETIKYIDSIKTHVNRRTDTLILAKQRSEFYKICRKINISEIETNNTNLRTDYFIRKNILPNKSILDSNTFANRYFRLSENPGIDFIYPTFTLLKDSTYKLNLQSRKAKELIVEIGGVFSSRSINTGYISLKLNKIKKREYYIKTESYFGKFYGSAKILANITFPTKIPFSLQTYYVINRWDYFRSLSSFFEDVKPSFIVQNEQYFGTTIKTPIGNNGKLIFDLRKFTTKDNYYQTENFTSKDTSDFTLFTGNSFKIHAELNTLNRKQFASSGNLISFKTKFIQGKEDSESGSTASSKYIILKNHSWVISQIEIQKFPIDYKNYHLGINVKATYSTQNLFSNYTATLLSMQEFSPFPDCQSLFLPEYRSSQFIGIGVNNIFSIYKNIDLRTDIYLYQQFRKLNKTNDISIYYEKVSLFSDYLISTSLIYNTALGPIRLTANYFPQQKNPVNLSFTYGYLLFNERAVK
jgi:NTE family protein